MSGPYSPLCPVLMFYRMCELIPAPDTSPVFVLSSLLGRLRPVLRVSSFLFFVLGCALPMFFRPICFGVTPFVGEGHLRPFRWVFLGNLGLRGLALRRIYLDISMPLKLQVFEGMVAHLRAGLACSDIGCLAGLAGREVVIVSSPRLSLVGGFLNNKASLCAKQSVSQRLLFVVFSLRRKLIQVVP